MRFKTWWLVCCAVLIMAAACTVADGWAAGDRVEALGGLKACVASVFMAMMPWLAELGD